MNVKEQLRAFEMCLRPDVPDIPHPCVFRSCLNNSFDTHWNSPEGGAWPPCPVTAVVAVVVVFMAVASCGRALCYCSHGNEY